MNDFFDIRERLRKNYIAKVTERPREVARGEVLGSGQGEAGFLTEVAGRVILTAPASRISSPEDLPAELGQRWEKAARGNQHMMWLQGRFVEAEKANRNGAFWSTKDLQFGEMSVKHGPLNWLHEETTVIGTIADNALIHPRGDSLRTELASLLDKHGTWDDKADTWTAYNGQVFRAEDVDRFAKPAEKAGVLTQDMPRPYIAAVSAVWRWVHPDKVAAVEQAAAEGKLWYSMECIAREMSCQGDETHEGCGKTFDYITAMTQPDKTCAHIQARSSARRLVDPSFLGGAVIVPPAAPGWGDANVEIIRQAASLAEQTHASAGDMRDAEWEGLMQQVMRFATS